jgi:hypothetical protein
MFRYRWATQRGKRWIVLSVVLAFGVLYRISLSPPVVTPDSKFYMDLAANLVRIGCFSSADPASAECSPSWERQPPGYPTFIAAIQVFSKDALQDRTN